ncbi:MAG TPA: hypothetical protein VMW72_24865, partial [Sedimentisphaerales bacterium]|nr:hypothetical protein [Sedimentisphaerales bacterium]
PFLAGCGFGWRCQQNSDYQPVGLHFASLPALSSLEPKRNLISLPVLSNLFHIRVFRALRDFLSPLVFLADLVQTLMLGILSEFVQI